MKPLSASALHDRWQFPISQRLCCTGMFLTLCLKFHAAMTLHAYWEVLQLQRPRRSFENCCAVTDFQHQCTAWCAAMQMGNALASFWFH